MKDGGVGVFCLNDRPVVFVELQLHRAELMINEFARLTPEPVEVTMPHNKRLIWKPAADIAWSDFNELEDIAKPSEKKPLRLTQMRRIAEKFSVVDHFGHSKEVMQKIDLRLMTSPVYRYGRGFRKDEEESEKAKPEIIDGAVFIFAQGTNPEAVLTIEAFRKGEEIGWRYCFTPSTVYEIIASFEGDEVWRKPRYQNFCRTYGPYFACPYRRHPDDDKLAGAFPGAKSK